MTIYNEHLVPPPGRRSAAARIIECTSPDTAAPPVCRNTLVDILLSITSEQNSDHEFDGFLPTGAEKTKF